MKNLQEKNPHHPHGFFWGIHLRDGVMRNVAPENRKDFRLKLREIRKEIPGFINLKHDAELYLDMANKKAGFDCFEISECAPLI